MLTVEQYAAVDAVLSRCGAVRDMYEFCIYVHKSIKGVIPFDYGRVYYLDDHANVFDERLFGPKRELSQEYHATYASSDAGAYSITRRSLERRSAIRSRAVHSPYTIYVLDWDEEPHDTRFYREYISRLGIRYSTGIALFDPEDRVRALLVFERFASSGKYTESECELLGALYPHLDNLFRNFFVNPPATYGNTIGLSQSGFGLTQRELDVAMLLLAGLSPKRIAVKLGISRSTVYKHVANIHSKLGVSSQLELVSKLRSISVPSKNGS